MSITSNVNIQVEIMKWADHEKMGRVLEAKGVLHVPQDKIDRIYAILAHFPFGEGLIDRVFRIGHLRAACHNVLGIQSSRLRKYDLMATILPQKSLKQVRACAQVECKECGQDLV